MTIKTFDEFTNKLDEGLFDMFKTRKQIVKLQSAVVDEYERLIDENPKKYKDGQSVLNDVKAFANKAYDKIVNSEDAISFNQWWESFEKAHANLLDSTIFNISK